MSSLYFIRHGQASALSDNYDQLSELGKKQAYFTGSFLAKREIKFNKIYYGPLQRHRQTVDSFCLGIQSELPHHDPEFILIDELEEHQGYKIAKSVLPKLIMENDEIQSLASRPYNDRNEQIKNYFNLYKKISSMWVNDELNGLADEFENWKAFHARSCSALKLITEKTGKSENNAIITSGGPISTTVGEVLQLDPLKILEISWVIHNCSLTTFEVDSDRISLSTFNTTHHFEEDELITLV